MTTKERKIKELRRRAAPINYATIDIQKNAKLEITDDRVIKGYLIKWGSINHYNEMVIKGACAKSIKERGPNSTANYKITFLWQHKQDDPLAVFAVLREDDYGLYFETKPLDDVPNADRCIKQIKSGTLNQFSIGFDYIWDKIEWDDEKNCLVLLELELFEGSVVTIGADGGTYAIRSKQGMEDLHDDIEDFIKTLPKKDRLQARKLFALQKSLINLKPIEHRKKSLQEDKPTKKVKANVDYNYLNKNW